MRETWLAHSGIAQAGECAPKMTERTPDRGPQSSLRPPCEGPADRPRGGPDAPLAPDAESITYAVTSFRAPRIGLLKIVLVGLFLLGALAFMAANVLHPGRAQRLRALSASEARLESMMLSLGRDNDRLMSELQRLERGAQGWQALARKEYGMLLEGEYVYRFPPDAHGIDP